MVVFPICKINLGLRVGLKRADGFHDLETVFFPVPLNDVLEVVNAADEHQEQVIFTSSGYLIAGTASDNLCVKAYKLLQKDFPKLPAVKMHLHKAVPMGAGLGGGSADAAFTLQLLNSKFHLGLSESQLISYSLQLGSDCPFFIINKPAFASGRGEILTPVKLNLSNYLLVLVNPGIHINTAWAFGELNKTESKKTGNKKSLKEVITQPLETWKHDLVNDFEKPVFHLYPEVSRLKENMYKQGALFAAMTGSGSTVFGMFEQNNAPVFDLPVNYFTKILHFN